MRKNTVEQMQGLSSNEAARLLREHGPNLLHASKKTSAVKIFASQFKDMMVLILLGSTVISLLVGEITEALTIIAIVFLNALLGFFQEYRTEKTLDALKEMASPTAHVLRDGEPVQIPADQVVPGDVLLLEAGDRVAADGQVLESFAMSADESLLSGESVASEKQPAKELLKKEDTRPNRQDMVYMGTTIVKGHGSARVVSTGMSSQMGGIAGMLGEIEEEPTPLQKKLDGLGKYIAIGCLAICAIVTVTGILRGEPVFDMFITGLSLSVAAIPEGLPAVVTIALGLAVSRMLKRNALIRRLHAVETLGCADVICSDKTGTLTENKMTVQEIATIEQHLTVTGRGYERGGAFQLEGKHVNLSTLPCVQMVLQTAVVCNNARLVTSGESRGRFGGAGIWEADGEPTEVALLIMAAKGNITQTQMDRDYTRISEIPFDSTRKCMSVVAADGTGRKRLFTKGAPDVLLEKCRWCMTAKGPVLLTPAMAKEISKVNGEMAGKALRVLGFAYKELESTANPQEDGLIWLGMAGMMDPPRKEAYQAVSKCRRAGIRPVMITGDHKMTAAAIAKELNILREGELVMTGEEIDRADGEQLERLLPKVSVFARVSPAHKLKIVRLLKKQGHIVAMTGDGVNDAPAVKEADIGVSMGIGGTDVTKEASAVVLLDDNFATLVAAVEEGRVIYRNIRKFIRYLLSCNIGEVVTMFVGMLMGLPVVLLPIQILLVNLVTDSLPAIALGLEPADDDVMSRPPRDKEDSIFSDGLLSKIIFRGLLLGLTTLAVFVTFINLYRDLATARTGALVTLVLTQLIHVFECKSEEKSIFGVHYFNNWKLIGAVVISTAVLLACLYYPILRFVMRTVALSGMQLLIVFGYCMAVPVLSAIFHKAKRR